MSELRGSSRSPVYRFNRDLERRVSSRIPLISMTDRSWFYRLTSILLSRLLLDLHAYTTRRETRLTLSGALSTIQFGGGEEGKQEHIELTAPMWATDGATSDEDFLIL